RRLQQVGRAGDVPRGVAAGLVGGANPAVREARRVGLTLGEDLARELRDRAALAVGRQEAVLLGGGYAGQRVEDVREVRRPLRERPRLQGRGDDVGNLGIQRAPSLDRLLERLEHLLRQRRLHGRQTENVGAEQGGRGRLLVVQWRGLVRVVDRRCDCCSPCASAHGAYLLSGF